MMTPSRCQTSTRDTGVMSCVVMLLCHVMSCLHVIMVQVGEAGGGGAPGTKTPGSAPGHE